MSLTIAHFIYILFVLIIIITMILKKDILVPCILGIFFLGAYYKGSIFGGIISIFNALIMSLGQLGPIILVIAIMVSLSRALEQNSAIEYMVSPFSKIIKNPTSAFFVIGFLMLILSWFFWPTPAVALVGAIFLPIALKAGLPAIGVAISLNLFGHGIALSTDFFIQGAPSITASSAGINLQSIISNGMVLFIVMSFVTITMAFYLLKKDLKKSNFNLKNSKSDGFNNLNNFTNNRFQKKAKINCIFVVFSFALDIIVMFYFKIKGNDSSALLGGTAMILIILINLINNGRSAFSVTKQHIIEGFVFSIKIFGIIIPIAAFFYLGSIDTFKSVFGNVLGHSSKGLLSDIGVFVSNSILLNKYVVSIIQTTVASITGLDGSGFSGLSLVGSLASILGTAVHVNIGTLAALGQIASVWVGGGCIVPWALIAAAAICGVDPIELAKKNFIPVITGLAVTTVVAMFIM